MTEELQEALLHRSTELGIKWCDLHPSCMQRFLEKGWWLVVDRRFKATTAVVVIDRAALLNFAFVLATLAEISAKAKRKSKP